MTQITLVSVVSSFSKYLVSEISHIKQMRSNWKSI